MQGFSSAMISKGYQRLSIVSSGVTPKGHFRPLLSHRRIENYTDLYLSKDPTSIKTHQTWGRKITCIAEKSPAVHFFSIYSFHICSTSICVTLHPGNHENHGNAKVPGSAQSKTTKRREHGSSCDGVGLKITSMGCSRSFRKIWVMHLSSEAKMDQHNGKISGEKDKQKF